MNPVEDAVARLETVIGGVPPAEVLQSIARALRKITWSSQAAEDALVLEMVADLCTAALAGDGDLADEIRWAEEALETEHNAEVVALELKHEKAVAAMQSHIDLRDEKIAELTEQVYDLLQRPAANAPTQSFVPPKIPGI